MAKHLDLNDAIRSIVTDEVKAILAPYQAILARMASFVGEAPVRRGPGRPRKDAAPVPAAPARASKRRRGGKGKKAGRIAAKFSEGQKVLYNQGRGTFEAKVLGVDKETGTLALERLSDGKEIVRPAAKVKAA